MAAVPSNQALSQPLVEQPFLDAHLQQTATNYVLDYLSCNAGDFFAQLSNEKFHAKIFRDGLVDFQGGEEKFRGEMDVGVFKTMKNCNNISLKILLVDDQPFIRVNSLQVHKDPKLENVTEEIERNTVKDKVTFRVNEDFKISSVVHNYFTRYYKTPQKSLNQVLSNPFLEPDRLKAATNFVLNTLGDKKTDCFALLSTNFCAKVTVNEEVAFEGCKKEDFKEYLTSKFFEITENCKRIELDVSSVRDQPFVEVKYLQLRKDPNPENGMRWANVPFFQGSTSEKEVKWYTVNDKISFTVEKEIDGCFKITSLALNRITIGLDQEES